MIPKFPRIPCVLALLLKIESIPYQIGPFDRSVPLFYDAKTAWEKPECLAFLT
jgi:hypothetical protein